MQIHATDVHKEYGDVTALDGVDLAIESGETFGLVGTNGAGKSTLFRLIAGYERPDSGTLRVGDRDVADAGWRVRESIGFLPERPGFPPQETAREVLRFHAGVRGASDEQVTASLETVGLADAADRRTDGFSTGMRRRLGLATALVARPQVLLLDEPMAGLDPNGVAALRSVFSRIREETDTTILLASHALPEVERVCDGIGLLHEGRLLARETTETFADDRVTVRLGFADDAETARVAETARDLGADAAVDGERLRAVCSTAEALSLLAAVREVSTPESVAVDGGLESAFTSLTGGGRDA